jgi:hypothetical protein
MGVIRLLHIIGLTNLSDNQVDRYYKLTKPGTSVLSLFHKFGLTNLSDHKVDLYESIAEQEHFSKIKYYEKTLTKQRRYKIALHALDSIRWWNIWNPFRHFTQKEIQLKEKDFIHLEDLNQYFLSQSVKIRPVINIQKNRKFKKRFTKTQIRGVIYKSTGTPKKRGFILDKLQKISERFSRS